MISEVTESITAAYIPPKHQTDTNNSFLKTLSKDFIPEKTIDLIHLRRIWIFIHFTDNLFRSTTVYLLITVCCRLYWFPSAALAASLKSPYLAQKYNSYTSSVDICTNIFYYGVIVYVIVISKTKFKHHRKATEGYQIGLSIFAKNRSRLRTRWPLPSSCEQTAKYFAHFHLPGCILMPFFCTFNVPQDLPNV